MGRNLKALDAVAVLAAFRDGSISPSGYAEYVADAAVRFASLNALQCFDPEHLSQSVKAAWQNKPDGALAGLPLVIKDNINTTNYPTSGGTGALLNHTPNTQAGVVAAIEDQGGVVGAKSGMHELAFGITSNNAATAPVRNPHNEDLIPGGSSGGSAAAIAAGVFPAGLGTDTGGSCRIPASLCGVVGFRPTTGRYDASGVLRISHTRDTVGTLARSVRDVVLLDQVLSGDTTSLDADMSGVTLGVPRAVFFDNLEPAVGHAVETQIAAFAKAGARITEVDLTEIWPHNEAFGFPVVLYEMMRDLPAYLSAHAPDVSFEALVAGIGSPDVAGAIGGQFGPDAMPEAVYAAALNVHRPAMRQIYAQAFEKHQIDALVFPTTPLTARPIGHDETVELNGQQVPTFLTYIRNTDLGSNIGVPGISLPCSTESDAMPIGIEFEGLIGQDIKLLALAKAAERVMANQ